MGFLSTVRNALALPHLAAEVGVASPWSYPNHLKPFTPPDMGDAEAPAISRRAAMRVPAVKRARMLVAGSIAPLSLRATKGGAPATTQPAFLSRTDGPVSPFHRMLWTIDDLFFYGWSLWAVERGADGYVAKADRVPFEFWSVDANGAVLYNGTPVDQASVVLIPGVDEGLLETGVDAVSHARTLLRAAAKAANMPAAQIELHQTGGTPLTSTQISELVGAWVKARQGENGGVAYTNQSIEAKELGTFDAHLLVEGRNAATVDVARASGIPAVMLDAALDNASMTYANVESRNAEFVDRCLRPYMSAVVARLGMDDVVPRGTAIEFDLTSFTAPAVGPADVPDDDDVPTDPAGGIPGGPPAVPTLEETPA